MRLIKLALISIVFLFIILTGISLLIPSHIRLSKAIDINARGDSVIARIKDVTQWKYWYPGVDSTLPYFRVNGEVTGIVYDTTTLRGVYTLIEKSDTNEVTAQYINKQRRPVRISWKVISSSASNPVTLQWYMDFHLEWYPWEKFSSLLYEKTYGPKMEEGLNNLKALMEKTSSNQ